MYTRFIKKYWSQLFLSLILLIIFAKNYIPATFLLGWDNLTPELNIWMNLKRSLLAVWQEYQGLGLVGGMGHSADLIRQIFILPLTLILPNSFIRYLYHFSMLTLGSFGILFFLKKHFKLSPLLSLLGSLFYLLNFGTIQNFYVPFEPFSCLWGFFPFLISYLLNYLSKPNSKNLKKLFILNLLATPSFYVQTNFIVYTLFVLAILTSHLLKNQSHFSLLISRYSKILLIIFLANSFWLLPFAYYLLSGNVQDTTLGFGNIMASQETFMRNLNRGKLDDFLLLRGYYYDFSNSTTPLMAPWVAYFQNHYILIIGYFLGIVSIIGILFSKHSWLKFSLILSAIALISAVPPFSFINTLLRSSPFLNQVFRSPFTKFITPTSFIFSLGLPLGIIFITKLFQNLLYKVKSTYLSLITIFFILIFSLPSFSGNLFYPQVRQSLPGQYIESINFFKTQPKTGRIANLPQGNFWGWTFYNWGGNGSGFLWYGIEQPILDRAFDVWSLKNENYYWQLNDALQKQDPYLFNQLLSQYDIQYILFDNSIYFPNERNYALQSIKTKQMLDNLDTIKTIATFDQITIYQTKYQTNPYLTDNQNFVSTLPQVTSTDIPLTDNLTLQNPTLCQNTSSNTKITRDFQNNLILISINDPNCYNYHLSDLDLTKPYILQIKYKNITGHSLTIAAFNQTNKYFFLKLDDSKDWTTKQIPLPVYTNDPYKTDLTIQIRSPSFNFLPTENHISQIQLFQADSTLQTVLPSQNKQYLPSSSNIFYYKVSLKNNSTNQYLVLPQSHDSGWLAFYFNGLKPVFLKDHVLVNNWANGWNLSQLEDQSTNELKIYILFWPQLLEFTGLALIPLTFFWFIHRSRQA